VKVFEKTNISGKQYIFAKSLPQQFHELPTYMFDGTGQLGQDNWTTLKGQQLTGPPCHDSGTG
jgi:hypothetical protein